MTDQIKKQGSIYIQTNKGVYPFSVLQKAEKQTKKQSKQLRLDARWMTQNNLIPPPYDPNSFLQLYEMNSTFWACVNQMATDVTGITLNIQLREGKKENQTELDRINLLLRNRNEAGDVLRNVLKKALVDLGTIGYFGLEPIRDATAKQVVEVYHVPAHTIRVHKSNIKFCQIRNNKKVWFKRFEAEEDLNIETGEIAIQDLPEEKKANELIFYKNFYPKSDYYGAPNILAAVGDVFSLIGVRDYNLAFFENYGIPSAIVILEGEWEPGSEKKVEEFLDQIKGAENAHKTLTVMQPDGCKFVYTPLATEVKEGAFKLFEKDRKEDILMCYGMPPERVGVRVIGKLGGNVAQEATKIYIQSTVEPLQTEIEELVNATIINSEIYELKFENIDLRDDTAENAIHVSQIQNGLRTPNEIRNEMGLKPYAGGDKFYIQSSLIEVGIPPDESLTETEKEFQERN